MLQQNIDREGMLDWYETSIALFDFLPEVNLWVKNLHGRFIMVNDNFVQMCGLKTKNNMLDKTDYDLFPRHLAEGYVKDDQRVIKSKQSIKNRVELIVNSDGTTNWYSTTKVPAYNKQGEVAGVGGFTVDLKKTDENIKPILKMSPAIEFIMNHYHENIEISKLAEIMCLSLSAFERQFKKHFNITPLKYLNRIRLEAVRQLLTTTDKSISEISLNTGFYDQSHLSRQFIKYTGTHPSKYRRDYSN